MLLESSLPRYSNVFNQRKPLAQKLGLQLVTGFCNLETYLNLEFETGKDVSENNVGDQESNDTDLDRVSSDPG